MQFNVLATGCSVNGVIITAYTNVATANNYIYVIAGVHGDEPEGVYLVDKLFAWLKQQQLSTAIVVVPQVNPDALDNCTRVNANQIDLNRNWPSDTWSAQYNEARYNPGTAPLSEPENIFLAELFKKYKPSLILSFHTLCPMLDHNAYARDAAEFLAQYNNYPVVDYIGYPTPGSLGSYVDQVLKCGIITYELPHATAGHDMQQIWLENAPGLQAFFTI